jgi:hypothetical protein
MSTFFLVLPVSSTLYFSKRITKKRKKKKKCQGIGAVAELERNSWAGQTKLDFFLECGVRSVVFVNK